MRGACARWKIENETFNTLKNQGYQLGHNFRLGKQHLSEVFVLLMILAFLVDQIMQMCCLPCSRLFGRNAERNDPCGKGCEVNSRSF